ncbi:hypothetical protein quinque_007841 [Culex quinquefasciatus]
MEKSVEFTVEIGSDSSDDFTDYQQTRFIYETERKYRGPVRCEVGGRVRKTKFSRKNILRVVSIRHPLAQINNGGPKFIENWNTNQFPTTQTSEEGKTSKRCSSWCFGRLGLPPTGGGH